MRHATSYDFATLKTSGSFWLRRTLVVIGLGAACTQALTVSGSGTAGGTLHVEGFWLVPAPIGNFQVSGVLGGKRVAVLVPEG